MEDKLLSISEAADLLGVSIKTLQRWDEAGKLVPQRTTGNQRRYSLSQVHAFGASRQAAKELAAQLAPHSGVIADPEAPRDEPFGIIDFVKLWAYSILSPKKAIVLAYAVSGLAVFCFLVTALLFLSGQSAQDEQQLSANVAKPGTLLSSLSERVHTFFAGAPVSQAPLVNHAVLGSNAYTPHFKFMVSVPSTFSDTVKLNSSLSVSGLASFSATLTAPNILYSVVPGTGISVGSGQNPVLSNTGVLSLQGQRGALAFQAGNGITLDGLTIENSDKGSDQKMFQSIEVGDETITAESNTDTLKFLAGTGILLSADATGKEITITGTEPPGASGWTTAGGAVYLTTTTDAVGIGTTNPSSFKLQVDGSVGPELDNTYDLGDATHQWRNLYLGNNLVIGGNLIATGNVAAFFLRNNGLLSPAVTSDDLAVGGTSTASATFHVDSATGSITTNGSLTLNGETISDLTGSGLKLTANALGLDLLTSVDGSGTSSNVSGLEIKNNHLTLLQGCSNNQILKWDATNSVWTCSNDVGAASSVVDVAEGNTTFNGNDTINFNSQDFDVVQQTTTAHITLDSTLARFRIANGAIYAGNTTTDLLLGGTASASAKFAFVNVNSGTPTASISAGIAGALSLSATGNLTTTTGQTLTLGSVQSGNIILNPTNGSGTVTSTGTFSLSSGKTYQINGTTVLSNTTLGSGVVSSSLTGTGVLTSGSIASGFGSILTASTIQGTDITASGTTGYISSGNGAGLNFSGSNNHLIQASGGVLLLGAATLNGAITGNNQSITGVNALSASGTITFSSFSSNGGLLYTNASGQLAQVTAGTATQVLHGGTTPSFSAVSLTADVTGTLPLTSGGTGFATYTQGDIIYASATDTLSKLGIGGNGTCLSSNGTVPSWASCASSNYWQLNSGTLSPFSTSLDLLLGGTATSSAKFAFTNVNVGTPTASVSAGTNGSLYLTADGTIQTTTQQTLTLGGATTGTILLSANGGTNKVNSLSTVNLASGKTYQINNIDVLSSNTLGSGIVNSSLTSVGTITSGLWNGTVIGAQYGGTGLNTSAATGVPTIASGTWSVSATLGSALGGTGFATYTQGDIIYASATNTLSKLGIGSNGTCLSSNGTVPTWAQCAANNYWQLNNGAISPFSTSLDLLVGATATSSAKFAFMNVNSGTPTASISGTANNALYLTGDGKLATTNKKDLTLGDGTTTGNVILTPSRNVGIGTTNPGSLFTVNDASGNGGTLVSISTTENGNTGANLQITADTRTLQFGANALIGPHFGSTAKGGFMFLDNNSIAPLFALSPSDGQVDLGTNSYHYKDLYLSGTTYSSLANIGTTNSIGKLTVSGAVTGKALAVFNETGDQDLFTASSSGVTKFTINNAGQVTTGIWNGSVISSQYGGTGFSTYAQGDVIYASGVNSLSKLSITGTNGQCLTSNGTIPSWGSCAANNYWQLSSGVLAPNDIANDLVLGAIATGSAKFQVFGTTGNVKTTGTLTLSALTTNGGLLYTNGSGVVNQTAAGSAGQCLQSNGGGAPIWALCSTGLQDYWQLNNGALSPTQLTNDILFGGSATASAKFAFINNASGTPTASISAGTTGGIFIDASGKLATTARQDLVLGDSSTTGNLLLTPSGNIGIGTTNPQYKFDVVGNAFQVRDAANATKAYRFRTSGSALDFEGGGADMYLSTWTNPDYTGTQNFYIRLESGSHIADLNGDWNFLTGNNSTNPAYAVISETGITFNQQGATNLNFRVKGDTDSNAFLVDTSSDSVNIGTSTPIGKFLVSSAVKGKALTIFNETGDQNILTASASGLTKFTVDRNGNLGLSGSTVSPSNYITTPNFVINTSGQITTGSWQGAAIATQYGGTGQNFSATAQGSLLYFSSAGTMAALGPGTAGQCLTTNGAAANPAWSSCAAGTNWWDVASGALSPINGTVDLLIGGTATTSAKFAFVNVNTGTPTASISAGTSGGAFLSATGTLAVTAKQNLTLGDSNTGNVILNPSGFVGIGTTFPRYLLSVNANGAADNASLSNTYGLIQNTGVTRFETRNATNNTAVILTADTGNAEIDTNNEFLYLGSASNRQIKLDTNANTLINSASGNVAIGTNTSPVAKFDVSAAITGKALTIFNETGDQDILTASASGTTKFAITNSGNIVLAGGTNFLGTLTSAATQARTWTLPNATGTIVLTGNTGTLQNKTLDNTNTLNLKDTNVTLQDDGDATKLLSFQLSGITSGNTRTLAIPDASGTICISGQTCASSGTLGYWQRNSTTLAPSTTGDSLLLADSGTTSNYRLEVNGRQTGKALTVFNETGDQNILTASASGTTRLNLDRTGNLSIIGGSYQISGTSVLSSTTLGAGVVNSSLTSVGTISTGVWNGTAIATQYGGTGQNFSATAQGSLLYFSSAGTMAALGPGTSGQCLITGGAGANPAWTSCAAGTNWWTMANGALSPINSTVDLLLGGTATSSAKFAFVNVNNGTPTASISAGATGGTFLTANGTLATTAKQTLSIGDANTGNVLFNGGSNVGIGLSNPSNKLHVFTSSANDGIYVAGGSSQDLSIRTNLSNGSFNPITVAGDRAIFYTGASADNPGGGFLIAPWRTGSSGLRLDEGSAAVLTGGLANGNAALAVNQVGAAANDIFTASASGTSKVTIKSSGNLQFHQASSLTTTTGGLTLAPAGNLTLDSANNVTAFNDASLLYIAGVKLSPTSDTTSAFNITESSGSITFAQFDSTNRRVRIGANNVSAIGTLHVDAANTGKALTVFNETGDQNILTASASGTTKFTIDRNGNLGIAGSTVSSSNYITAPNFVLTTAGTISSGTWNGTAIATQYGGTGQNFSATAQGNILYFSAAGTMAALGPGSANQCLTTGGAGANPSWQTCSLTTSYWNQANGALSPINSTVDFLVGGSATNSAKFAVINVNNGTPVASVSAGASGASYLSANGNFSATAMQTLTLGGSTTGSILIDPGTGGITLGDVSTDRMTINAQILGGSPLVFQGSSDDSFTTTINVSNPTSNRTITFPNNSGTVAINMSGSAVAGTAAFVQGGQTWATTATLGTQDANPINFITTNSTRLSIDATGNVGIGTTSPTGKFHVTGAPSAGGNALAIFNQTNSDDIFTASASGTTRLTLSNGGNLNIVGGAYQIGGSSVLSSTTLGSTVVNSSLTSVGTISTGVWNGTAIPTQYGGTGQNFSATAQGNILYFSAAGVMSALGPGTSGQCLTTGGAGANPAWAPCSSAGTNWWTQSGGAVQPINTTLDLLVGGTATSSAKFAIINVNSGTPTASVSAGATGAVYMTAQGKIATTAKQNLTLGDSTTTGNVIVNPAGNVGIGITAPTTKLYVNGDTTVNGTVYFGSDCNAGCVYNGGLDTFSDMALTAHSAGNITIGSDATIIASFLNNGNVGIGNPTPVGRLDVSGAVTGKALTIFNETGNQNLLTASASGVTKFTVDRNGNVGLGGSTVSSSNYITAPNFVLNTSGQVTTGTWQATAIATQYGGTGQNFSATAQGNVLYFSSAGTMAALGPGTAGQCLTTGGAGANPSWQSCALGATPNWWSVSSGALSPINSTVDMLLGSSATTSAKFAFVNVNSGTPTASVSAGAAGAFSLTANGTLATTAMQTLTIGGTTTGNITLSPNNGTNQVNSLGNLNLSTGKAFTINNSSVLSGTTLGSGVVNSSLTSVGTISTGVWNGTAVATQYGGTGQNFSATAQGNILYFSAAGTMAALGPGSVNQCLTTGGAGANPSWQTCALGASPNWWNVTNGAVAPINNTLDLLVGSTATGSAKFAVINVNNGTPVASVSAGAAGGAFLNATGTLGTTAKQTLTLGTTTTGDINIGTDATARTVTMGNTTGASALTYNSGTGPQTFNSSVATGTTSTSGFVFNANAINSGTGMYLTSSSITSGKLLDINTAAANTLTSGVLLNIANSSSALTTGSLLSSAYSGTAAFTGNLNYFDWTPGSSTTATGDLFRIHIGPNGNVANLFNIVDDTTSLFSVTESQITSAVPHQFTAAGDVGIAYDLAFTNQTASYIKSNAPLILDTGESWESNDLTFRTYNSGNVIFDTSAFGSVIIGTTGTPQAAFQVDTKQAGKALTIFNETGDQAPFTASVSGSTKFIITNAGKTGIGIAAPNYALHVQDSQAATYSAMIENIDTGTSSRVLALKHGATTPNTNSRWIDFMGGNGFIRGHIAGNGSNFAALTSGGGDYAEKFAKANANEDLAVGTLICSAAYGVTACNETTNTQIIGVISDNYNVLGNAPEIDQPNHVIVGLVGQVAAKVTGTIHRGDMLGVSSISGVATKASKAGFIVGKAQEDHTGSEIGTMMVTMQPGWYDPDVYITNTGDVSVFAKDATSYGVNNLDGTPVSRNGLFDQIVAATIRTGGLDAKRISLNGTDLMDLLSQDSSATTSAETNTTLAVLSARVASAEATLVSHTSRISLLENKLDQVASEAAFLTSIMNSPTGVGTNSASLMADLEQLDVNTATVSGTLSVLGKTTLADLGITGDITAGVLSIHGLQGQINTLGNPLQLQSYGVENIEMEQGKVIVDTDGNITLTQGHLIGNNSFRGQEPIAAGDTSIYVNQTWDSAPKTITITPSYNTTVWVDQITTSGFRIHVGTAPSSSQKLYWMALW